MTTPATRDPRIRELERRIVELEASDDAELGRFTAWDWAVCVVFAVVLPLLAVWRYAA